MQLIPNEFLLGDAGSGIARICSGAMRLGIVYEDGTYRRFGCEIQPPTSETLAFAVAYRMGVRKPMEVYL